MNARSIAHESLSIRPRGILMTRRKREPPRLIRTRIRDTMARSMSPSPVPFPPRERTIGHCAIGTRSGGLDAYPMTASLRKVRHRSWSAIRRP
jgi:hypothetical protein